jgi:hypothetical protein
MKLQFIRPVVDLRLYLITVGSRLPHLVGYPFEVRYSDGSLMRARAAADVAADAYVLDRQVGW